MNPSYQENRQNELSRKRRERAMKRLKKDTRFLLEEDNLLPKPKPKLRRNYEAGVAVGLRKAEKIINEEFARAIFSFPTSDRYILSPLRRDILKRMFPREC